MLRRILYGYISSIIIVGILIPVAKHYTMGGHSFMFVFVFGSIIGLILGFSVYDVRMRYKIGAILLRNLAAFILIIAIFLFISVPLDAILRSNGWILIPLITPPLASIISNLVLKENRMN